MSTDVASPFCRVCRRLYAKGQPDETCSVCRRHLAYGAIVRCFTSSPAAPLLTRGDYEWLWNGLDALAALMGITTRLRRAHNRELFDEQRQAQRDARDAVSEASARRGEW